MKKSEIKAMDSGKLLHCAFATSDELVIRHTDKLAKEWMWMVEELTKRLGVDFEEFKKMM